MAQLIGYFRGPRPFRQLRRRMWHAQTMGDYEVPGVVERLFSPYVMGRKHLAGLGGDPITSYVLSIPGRVSEVKKALRLLGQAAATPSVLPGSDADIVREALWAQLTDDDTWDDATADEFVTFLSRWAPRYLCYAVPLYLIVDGLAQPTMNGLLLLDVALRYQAANVIDRSLALLQACGYGTASAAKLDLLESALLGSTTAGSVDLNPSLRNSMQVIPTSTVAPHPIAPPDGDSTLYSQWKNEDAALANLYTQLAAATSESARSTLLDALATERQRKDAIARQIIAQAPPRQGETTVTCGDPNDVFDATLGQCVPKPKPASVTPMLGWVVAGGIVLAIGATLFGESKPKKRRRAA